MIERKFWQKIKERLSSNEAFWGYLFLTPTLIGLFLFSAGAMIATGLLSFTDWSILTPPKWVALQNYRALLFSDALFIKALGNTIYYTFSAVPLSLFWALFFALFLNGKIRGVTVYRTIYFLPVVSSIVAIALLWGWLYHSEFGLINYVLSLFHIKGPNWLADPSWSMPAVIIMSAWQGLGYPIVIFLAGLQNIPTEYYEAAQIDGAKWYHLFTKITLPLLSPTIFFLLVTSLIGSFQVFESTFILTRGGPVNSTLTLVYYLFMNAFDYFRMGYASAIGMIGFIIVLIFTLVQLKFQKRWVHYE
jgi:multiple sugar transport system permease protein